MCPRGCGMNQSQAQVTSSITPLNMLHNNVPCADAKLCCELVHINTTGEFLLEHQKHYLCVVCTGHKMTVCMLYSTFSESGEAVLEISARFDFTVKAAAYKEHIFGNESLLLHFPTMNHSTVFFSAVRLEAVPVSGKMKISYRGFTASSCTKTFDQSRSVV